MMTEQNLEIARYRLQDRIRYAERYAQLHERRRAAKRLSPGPRHRIATALHPPAHPARAPPPTPPPPPAARAGGRGGAAAPTPPAHAVRDRTVSRAHSEGPGLGCLRHRSWPFAVSVHPGSDKVLIAPVPLGFRTGVHASAGAVRVCTHRPLPRLWGF